MWSLLLNKINHCFLSGLTNRHIKYWRSNKWLKTLILTDIHGIDRILLGQIFFWLRFFFIEKTDMTLPNRVIFKFSGYLWPDGQVYSMYDWHWVFLSCYYYSLRMKSPNSIIFDHQILFNFLFKLISWVQLRSF